MTPMTPPGEAGGPHGPARNTALLTMIQLSGANGYSGAVAVSDEQDEGTLYFSGGQIVHAVAGRETGESALRRILSWPRSEYVLDPDATSPGLTITRGLEVLLADARGQKEPRRELTGSHPRPAPAGEPAGGARRIGLAAIADQARSIPGVECAVLHDRGGVPVGPGPLAPIEEEALLVGRLAKGLGDILNAGPLVLGVVHGSLRNVLLLTSKEIQLTILVKAGSLADAAQAQIRKLLSAQP